MVATMLSTRSFPGRASRPPPSREVEYRLINETVNEICGTIKKFAQKYFTQRQIQYKDCVTCFQEVATSINVKTDNLGSWKEFREKLTKGTVSKGLQESSAYGELMLIFDRSRDFEVMIPQIREKLVTCVKEHVYKYCHSFAEETGGIQTSVVADYENQIRNYRRDIENKITSINSDILRYSEVKSPLEKFIGEGGSVGTLMENICVQIVEISHDVKKWISDDAAYPDKLQQEIVFNSGYNDTLQEDVIKLYKRRSSLERSIERRAKHCKKVERDYKIFRTEKRKRKSSLQTVNAKIEKYEFQIAQKGNVIEGTRTALSTRRIISPRQEEELHMKIDKNVKEVERLNDWLVVALRQRIRLERELKEISDRAYELKVELVTTRQEQEEMIGSLEGMNIEVKSMQERLEDVNRKTEVMKHIRLLKMSPETLRKLYRRRREFYQQGQLNEACRFVAQEIAGEWKRLYACLPFEPQRDSTKRLHDIELIDLISARRDKTLEEQALKSLEKWRTFNRKNADVPQLIRGLRKLNKADLADKVEMRFSIEDVYG